MMLAEPYDGLHALRMELIQRWNVGTDMNGIDAERPHMVEGFFRAASAVHRPDGLLLRPHIGVIRLARRNPRDGGSAGRDHNGYHEHESGSWHSGEGAAHSYQSWQRRFKIAYETDDVGRVFIGGT
jgi:hypothetical protein